VSEAIPPDGREPDAPPEAERRQLAAFHQAMLQSTPRTYFSWSLIAANAAVWLLMVVRGAGAMDPTGEELIAWGANYGPMTLAGQWWRLLSSAFLHIGVVHLLVNMWALWSIGPFVERLLGNARYLALYLLAALGGSLASVAWNPQIISAGASGALFGVFGAFMANLIRHRREIPPSVRASMWKNVLVLGAINIGYGLIRPGIDNAAHLGGLGTGFLAGLVLARPLAPSPAFREWGRAALAAVTGAGLLALAATALPKAVPDVRGEVRIAIGEIQKADRDFADCTARFARSELSGSGYAAIMDRDILPGYRSALRRLDQPEGLSKLPPEARTSVGVLAEYARARVSALTTLVGLLRSAVPGSPEEEQARKDARQALKPKADK